MKVNRKNILKSMCIVCTLLVSACGTPIAPTQPEDGVVMNYRANYRVSKLSNQTIGVVKASDGTVTVNGIPFFEQGDDNTCGQASITSILNFWDVDIDYQTVINESNPTNFATDLEMVQAYLINKGLKVTLHQKADVNVIKDLIDAGKPPIVLLDFGSLSKEHYVVVSGYNAKKQTILVNDPRNKANMSVSVQQFNQLWQNTSLGNLVVFGDKYVRPVFEISG